MAQEMNAYAPTNTRTVPRGSDLAPEAASQLRTPLRGGKARLLKLNIQTPSPPRGAVPVNQGLGFMSLFHLSRPGSLSVRNATVPAMLARRVSTRLIQVPFGSPPPAVTSFQPRAATSGATWRSKRHRNRRSRTSIESVWRMAGETMALRMFAGEEYMERFCWTRTGTT